MKTIYKYPLSPIVNLQGGTIDIPSPKILSVESQGNDIVVYAMVDTNERNYQHKFRVYATGSEIKEDLTDYTFMGTVKMYEYSSSENLMVFHVFHQLVK